MAVFTPRMGSTQLLATCMRTPSDSTKVDDPPPEPATLPGEIIEINQPPEPEPEPPDDVLPQPDDSPPSTVGSGSGGGGGPVEKPLPVEPPRQPK
jgi:hypothetical protein